jgi:hypothetical protein
MTSYLYKEKVKIFDYPRFAEPFRQQIRENAEALAAKNGLDIIFVRSSKARKKDLVKSNWDGQSQGLVCILSAMESCQSYRPWHDKGTHSTFLKFSRGKCLHYYFYFNDPDIGFGYVRVPTWCPFMLQVYLNGHNWLACQLANQEIAYSMLDNAFDYIADFEQAQKQADQFDIKKLHKKLDWLAGLYCPAHKHFDERYHWSIMQAEYASDIAFKKQNDLDLIYEDLIRTAIHSVKPANIASFLGQKLHGNYKGGNGK